MPDKPQVTLAVLIDALSWDALEQTNLLARRAAYRSRIRTILGYSSAAVPSILTGKLPREHGRWSYLYYDPVHSPFGWARVFQRGGRLIDNHLIDNPKLKQYIARRTAQMHGFDGYFPVYDFPLSYLPLMDHCSKDWDFKPAAFACPSVIDILMEKDVPAHYLTYPMPAREIFAACAERLDIGYPGFYFLYLTDIDALGHAHGPTGPAVLEKLRWYDRQLELLFDLAESKYDARMFVFSDHGMVETARVSRLKNQIEASDLRFGEDYVAMFDSTMARFWYLNPASRDPIEECLKADGHGRILSDAEKQRYGIDFAGDKFGETIYLLRSGTVFHPSHMSRRVLKAMHGFDPDDLVNDGVFLSTCEPKWKPECITDILPILLDDLGVVSG